MQPTPALLSQLEQVLSPQNNCAGAGSVFKHDLTSLASTDATCFGHPEASEHFHSSPHPPSPVHGTSWSSALCSPIPSHPTTLTPAFALPTPGLCRGMVSDEEHQLLTALCPGGCRRMPRVHLACPQPTSPRTNCSLCSQ